MSDFAKLEVIADRQILAELTESDDGPKVRVRRDRTFTMEISYGPWPDTDDGWDAAQAFFDGLSMVLTAAEMDTSYANLFPEEAAQEAASA